MKTKKQMLKTEKSTNPMIQKAEKPKSFGTILKSSQNRETEIPNAPSKPTLVMQCCQMISPDICHRWHGFLGQNTA